MNAFWRAYFSKAFVQPPTRLLILDHLSIQYIDMFRYTTTIQCLKKTTVCHLDTVTAVDITWQPKCNTEVWMSHRCNAILRWSALQRGGLGWCWLRSTYCEASRECWRGENSWWKGGRCKPWAYRGCSWSRHCFQRLSLCKPPICLLKWSGMIQSQWLKPPTSN